MMGPLGQAEEAAFYPRDRKVASSDQCTLDNSDLPTENGLEG